MTRTAIRTDRAVPAAHGGAGLRAFATKQLSAPIGTCLGVSPAYVTGQESNPPREESG